MIPLVNHNINPKTLLDFYSMAMKHLERISNRIFTPLKVIVGQCLKTKVSEKSVYIVFTSEKLFSHLSFFLTLFIHFNLFVCFNICCTDGQYSKLKMSK